MGLILHTLGRDWGQRGDRHDSPQKGLGALFPEASFGCEGFRSPGGPSLAGPPAATCQFFLYLLRLLRKTKRRREMLCESRD